MARCGQAMKDRVVGRLLLPASGAVSPAAQESRVRAKFAEVGSGVSVETSFVSRSQHPFAPPHIVPQTTAFMLGGKGADS